ncbi:hypothetical protein acdb102_30120 [Acidothermaceae bacterium B102]|nr:hypothetical protein acdb102_30120 [Acidothermaceae bacterium B102]
MRWQALFADLEAQYDAAQAAELAAEVADRTRREAARLRLCDRLAGAVGGAVTVDVWGAGAVRGRLVSAGVDWVLVEEQTGGEVLVPEEAVTSVRGLTAWSQSPGSEGVVAGRLDLRYCLRGVARNRAGVSVVLRDASVVTGTIDRVGFDFFELAEHPMGEPRRASAVQDSRAVRLAAVALLRSW